MSTKSSNSIPLALTTFFIVICFSNSCERKAGPEGKQSLIDLISEAPGLNCPSGGYKITTGVDLNSNGLLEESEIQNTKYICHGDDGHNSITYAYPEEAGEICLMGGVRIITGIDLNNNSILDSSEVKHIEYICNGKNGEVDKQIRFDFGSIRSVWENCTIFRLQLFNIDNYPDVDSVLFMATLQSESANTECIVELYNFTDNQPIENGELRTNANVAQVGTKVNLLAYLPRKEIELGMRVRSSVNGSPVYLSYPQLILYRK